MRKEGDQPTKPSAAAATYIHDNERNEYNAALNTIIISLLNIIH